MKNWPLVQAEWRLLMSRAEVKWVALLISILTALTFTQAFLNAHSAFREASQIQKIERDRWLSQPAKNPHSAGHYGLWLFKPNFGLSIIDPGISPYVGRMIRIEAHKSNDAIYPSVQDTPKMDRLAIVSPSDVTTFIAPLMALLLGFSSFASDRQRGTLRMMLGNGATLGQMLRARMSALLGAVGIIVGGPLLVFGSLANLGLGPSHFDEWWRLACLILTQVMYVSVFAMLGLCISLVSHAVQKSLVACLVLWVGACLIAPRFVAQTIEAAIPTPSYTQMRHSIEAEIKAYNSAELHQQRQAAILRQFEVTDAKALPIDLRGAMLHDREQYDYSVFDRHFIMFEKQIDRQMTAYALSGFLSPTLALQNLSQAFSGADYFHHLRFLRAAEAYRRVLSDTMNLDLRANPSAGDQPYLASPEVWKKVPAFAHVAPTWLEVIGRSIVPILALLFWVTMPIGLCAIALKRVVQ